MNWVALRMLDGRSYEVSGHRLRRRLRHAADVAADFDFCRHHGPHRQPDHGRARRRHLGDGCSKVRFIDEVPPLPETDLQRVRGVHGVAWAVRMYKGQVTCRLRERQVSSTILFGLDDDTLVGAPRQMVAGNVEDLKLPGRRDHGPSRATNTCGRASRSGWAGTFEMNDRRAVLVGVCKVSPPFTTLPVLYTRYSQAESFVPHDRNLMSFILAKPQPEVSADEVCRRIEDLTKNDDHRKLTALTQKQFFWKTIVYFLKSHRHPGELRHHDCPGLRRRRRDRRADVLPVHGREPEAIRGAQGDGRLQHCASSA